MASGPTQVGGPGRRKRCRNHGIGSGNFAAQMRSLSVLVDTGRSGHISWPMANPTQALPRYETRRQMLSDARLEAKGGAGYLDKRKRQALGVAA